MTQRLRVVVADDEPDARAKLRRILDETGDATVVGEAGTGIQAADAIGALRPDVAFLDIRMPDLDGFGVVEALSNTSPAPKIVFVTAYDEYAVHAFDVRALDYVLKPYDAERMSEALRRVRQQLEYEHRPTAATLTSLLQRVRDADGALPVELTGGGGGGRYIDRVCVRSLGKTQFVRTSEIEWVEAYGNYVRLHSASERVLLRQPLRRLVEQLDPAVFCRVHRSAVVNLDYVEEMRPYETGDYILRLRSGTRLKLSRVYRAEMDRRVGRKGGR